MKPNGLCYDIDNVIAKTDEVMRRIIREKTSDHVDLAHDDVIEFDYWRCTDSKGRQFSRSEWESIHNAFSQADNIRSVEPFEKIQEHLKDLSSRFAIHLVTSRLPAARAATLEWLSAQNLAVYPLHFVGHRKKHLCGIDFSAAVDDDAEQAKLFSSVGIAAYLLAQPWNVVPETNLIKRVASWDELLKVLLRP